MASFTLSRNVRNIVSLSKQVMSPAFYVYGVRRADIKMDPFMNVDNFYMSEAFFPPHPHAGFSAVTYLFPDSENSVLNTDSLGDRTIIQPGALHWTQAGRGLMHEEIPAVPGKTCHGLQIFVNNSAANKLTEPKALHLNPDEVPVYATTSGARARVLTGQCNGVCSPLELVTPVTFLDVTLPAGAALEFNVPTEQNVFAMVVKGSVLFGPLEQQVGTNQVCDFEADAETVFLKGQGPELAQVVVFAGEPLNQASIWRGPFNGVTQEQVNRFVEAYQAGKMGRMVSSVGNAL